ncbi:MAG: flagellar hook-length control protein FliK [Sulfuricellaceae bacterium]|nr:flagellar hook-length control protein FliK [Sulfuricellaceae bacterium]
MIHNDILNQLQYLIKTSAPPLLEVAEHPAETAEWVPGQKLQATVLASLPNGRFNVLVSDLFLEMNLPKNTQPGEKLDLTFISNQPRLTFALSQDVETAAQTHSSVLLSDTAKFLGGLLQKLSTLAEGQTSPLTKSAPLLTAAGPESTKEFAVVLQKTLTQSGLFYESHQAQWVSGQRSLQELLQEPQAKLSPSVLVANDDSQNQVRAAPQNSQAPHALPNTPSPLAAAADDKTVIRAPIHAEQGVHPQTLPLVQQQLNALDNHQLIWQGQVWPGQDMRWEIEERPARDHEGREIPAWQTTLRLQLPQLGDVNAVMSLSPSGIQIHLNVDTEATGSRLKSARPALLRSFEAAGLRLSGVTVEQHGAT